MTAVICTLFEGHYHYGVAALTNSLYKQGYRGAVYAGYRGSLPEWASSAKENNSVANGCRTLQVGENVQLHFLPIDTPYHLTNYKPDFMLRLFEGPAKDATAIAYFDPDIVLKCKWNFFETWMSHGVALVHEITANDMPQTHPIRKEWEKVIRNCEMRTTRRLQSYINGGFCGVSRENIEFLHVWQKVMNAGIKYFGLEPTKFMPSDRTHIFFASDQDALNIAAMCCECPVSEIGPEGMDFIHGGWTMSHAIGSPKPWKKRFVLSALQGRPPSLPDNRFWVDAEGPIACFGSLKIKLKRKSILVGNFIGRFYRLQ